MKTILAIILTFSTFAMAEAPKLSVMQKACHDNYQMLICEMPK